MKKEINRNFVTKKKTFFSILTLVLLLFVAMVLPSCKDKGEETYTVWTETDTYSQFQSAFQTTLNDGYYIRVEITQSQWEQIGPKLGSNGRHNWDQAAIKKWLISNGFGESEANKESSWLALVGHGFLAVRSGNLVYIIVK
ncbi:MAG: hypothetical protein KBT27_14675 [Prevotellaceae bacterium]|nr:hypothetical protein [Candidatus Faecinaster equi]